MGTEKEGEAKKFLDHRRGTVVTGAPILPRVERITYAEVSADLKTHYKSTGERGEREAANRFRHLDPFFGGLRLATISGSTVAQYVAQRQATGAANGTINRELGVLGKMLRLAYKNHKLMRLPLFSRLKEAAPREGFFEADQFEAVRRRLPEDLQCIVTIAYTYGWRVPSEVLTLERRQLDLAAGTLRLDPGTTKNREGRVVYLTPQLATMLTAQVERVRALERQLGRIVPWLFPLLVAAGGTLGKQRRTIYAAWAKACLGAGIPGRIPHDFRRTAVRNFERAGVSRSVAMKMTGHRTEGVYRRYAIVSDQDLQDAVKKMQALQESAPVTMGTITGTITPKSAIPHRQHTAVSIS